MRQKKKRLKVGRCFILLGFLILFVIGSIFFMDGYGKKDYRFTLMNDNAYTKNKEFTKEIDFERISVSDVYDNGFLQLVNQEYPVNHFKSGEIVSAFHVIPVSTSELKLEKRALDGITSLIKNAKSHGVNDLFVYSGYRTYEKQLKLYNEAVDKSYVQKPNHSEHQTGLAVDIGVTGVKAKQFGDYFAGGWVFENAWKEGFIMRYPNDKVNITGISYEPWHFRYVGLPHAYICTKNNLCFEEYIRILKEKRELEVTIDGICYYVFYKYEKNGTIKVPKNYEYEISSDNTGGYIITVKKG